MCVRLSERLTYHYKTSDFGHVSYHIIVWSMGIYKLPPQWKVILGSTTAGIRNIEKVDYWCHCSEVLQLETSSRLQCHALDEEVLSDGIKLFSMRGQSCLQLSWGLSEWQISHQSDWRPYNLRSSDEDQCQYRQAMSVSGWQACPLWETKCVFRKWLIPFNHSFKCQQTKSEFNVFVKYICLTLLLSSFIELLILMAPRE